MTAVQRIQQRLWAYVYPFFPHVERLARSLRFSGRQPFLLGRLHPERSLNELQHHLCEERGFEHAVLAWVDDGQVLSLRKCISFEHQYHIRVFEDGEMRGHFEYTPEAAPMKHILGVGREKRSDDFCRLLEGYLHERSDG